MTRSSAIEDTQIIYSVLANDTDADGTADFKITSVTDPEHGTATISADGKTIIYIPDLNYSGADSFGYAMIDGHGGGDNAVATIGVIAVADAPTLTVSTTGRAQRSIEMLGHRQRGGHRHRRFGIYRPLRFFRPSGRCDDRRRIAT